MISTPHGEYENDGRAVVKERLTSEHVSDDYTLKVPREQGGCSPTGFVNGPPPTRVFIGLDEYEIVTEWSDDLKHWDSTWNRDKPQRYMRDTPRKIPPAAP